MIHWAGYGLAASMPYARTFLRYRLPRACRRERLRISCAALRAA